MLTVEIQKRLLLILMMNHLMKTSDRPELMFYTCVSTLPYNTL